ncbi:hypothetical protein [Marixanthomonas ophiurae]|uniref:Uncharacterized protein n=1 Tax=Marixanthomonas ophiurae TaxID=387659 RepID=A0A3E1Q7X2_9FLAO|nr:hypothetical protein [Marixanthomonas ophiurae]RFN58218.1 hypothetical protein DZ858_13380 [Marixanthomonas ophiurae]
MSDKKEKKHADFQDKYRRSSNFGTSDKELNVDKDGNLKATDTDKKTTKEVRKSVDKLLSSEEEE